MPPMVDDQADVSPVSKLPLACRSAIDALVKIASATENEMGTAMRCDRNPSMANDLQFGFETVAGAVDEEQSGASDSIGVDVVVPELLPLLSRTVS